MQVTVRELKKFLKENKVDDDAIISVDMGHASDPTDVYAIEDYEEYVSTELTFLIDAEIRRIK